MDEAADGLGITVSYWESEEAIANWKVQGEHRLAQGQGFAKWYSEFFLHVCSPRPSPRRTT